MSDELIMLATNSGFFSVGYRDDPIKAFQFEIGVNDNDKVNAVMATIAESDAHNLLEFLKEHLEKESLGYEAHEFQPYNVNWYKPRCIVCQKFEDHYLHKIE